MKTVAPPTPLHGRYLVGNPALNAALRTSDWVIERVVRSRDLDVRVPERIVVGIGGHRGDAVIATAALAEIRALLPHAQLTVVTPSWNRDVLAGHPDIAEILSIDHWRLDRSGSGITARIARHARSFDTTVRALRAGAFDIAIDTYPFYPSMSPIFWRAGIGRRAGFTSGGGGGLHTRRLHWMDDRRHIAEKQREIVHLALGISDAAPSPLAYRLPPPPDDARRAVDALLGEAGRREFIAVHAGSGTRKKDWPVASWHALAAQLSRDGRPIVLTGHGPDETERARQIVAAAGANAPIVDLVGRLAWSEFVEVIRRAAGVVTGDTVTGHVAAAFDRPVVVLFSGVNDVREWRPLGRRVGALIHGVPCAPCFRNDGCETMACVREIPAGRVLMELEAVMARP